MAVKRVVTVRAENGASVPPPMEGWEKMLGLEWRFSGVSTGHTDGVKPPTFYHTYQLVEPDDGQETPASTTGLPGEVCSTCDGNSSTCPVCNPTELPEGYLD